MDNTQQTHRQTNSTEQHTCRNFSASKDEARVMYCPAFPLHPNGTMHHPRPIYQLVPGFVVVSISVLLQTNMLLIYNSFIEPFGQDWLSTLRKHQTQSISFSERCTAYTPCSARKKKKHLAFQTLLKAQIGHKCKESA